MITKISQTKSFFFGLAIITSFSQVAAHAEVDQQKPSLWKRLGNKFNELITEIKRMDDPEWLALVHIESYLGARTISEENETYIRNILHEIQLPDAGSVRIRQLSKAALMRMTEKNACVVTIDRLPRYFYVNESWLNNLTEDEKQFLLLHEAMHLKLNHSQQLAETIKTVSVLPGIFGTVYAGLLKASVLKFELKNEIIQFDLDTQLLKGAFISLLISAGCSELARRYLIHVQQKHELEADAGAVVHMLSTEGAQGIFHQFDEQEKAFDADLPQHPDLVERRKKLLEILHANDAHPTNEKRLAHVKQVLDEELKKRALALNA